MPNETVPGATTDTAAAKAATMTTRAADATREAAQNTSQAAAQTHVAAAQATVAARAVKSSAERATELASDRTVLAFERTYAAWVRTGLVALASGIGARRLLEGVVPVWMATAAGTVLLLFSAICFAAGVWRHLFRVEAPTPATAKMPRWLLITVNGFLAFVALAAAFGIMFGGAPR